MILNLKNFLCWDDKSFDFDDTGLILLNGPSGRGKTSVLKAINFLITGKGNKLVSHGKSTCSVTMDYNGYFFLRGKKPNRLIVKNKGKEYLDDAAQGIIDNIFPHFQHASYIQQKGIGTFLSLSPRDKLIFLENLAIDFNLQNVKNRLRNEIKECDREMTQVVAKRSMTDREMKRVIVPNKVKCSVEKKDRKEYKKRPQTISLELKDLHQKLEGILKEQQKSAKDVQQQFDIQKRLEELIIPDKPKFTIYEINNKRKEIKIKLQTIHDNREYVKLQSQIQALEEGYEEEKEKLIKYRKKGENMQEFTEEDEIETDIKLWSKINLLNERVNEIKEQMISVEIFDEETYNINIEKLEKDIKELEYQFHLTTLTHLECPGCKSHLCLENDTLKVYSKPQTSSKDIKKDIQHNNKKRQKLRKYRETVLNNIKTQKRLKKELISIKIPDEPIISVDDLKKKLKIGLNCNSERIKLLKIDPVNDPSQKIQINRLQKKMKKLKKIDIDETEDTLHEHDVNYQEEILKWKYYEKCLNDKEQLLKKVKNIEQPPSEHGIQDNIDKLEEEQTTVQSTIDIIHQVEEYRRIVKEYNKWCEENNNLTEREEELTIDLEKRREFDNLIMKAETQALLSVIDNLNILMGIHLEDFFQEEPLTAELRLFKEKIQRPMANFSLGYKGMDCDLTTLSGGERDRVEMAFTLSLAEECQTPILMFDESISSLDAELSEDILSTLKKMQKMIIIVSHQSTTGIFTQVIDL
jgi:energy-coupling factor transporter ATP-binding protein EcfA2